MSVAHELVDFRLLRRPRNIAGPVLAGAGFFVWTGLSILSGLGEHDGFRLAEAWDTPAYFYLGLPLMAMMVAAVGFLRPKRVWRWPLWLVGGHQAGVLLVGLGMQSGLSLIILTVMMALLLAALFAVPAAAGSVLARRIRQRPY